MNTKGQQYNVINAYVRCFLEWTTLAQDIGPLQVTLCHHTGDRTGLLLSWVGMKFSIFVFRAEVGNIALIWYSLAIDQTKQHTTLSSSYPRIISFTQQTRKSLYSQFDGSFDHAFSLRWHSVAMYCHIAAQSHLLQ